jgi:hypothetical protein
MSIRIHHAWKAENGVDQMMSRGVAAGDISTCEMAISRPVK